MLLAFDMKEGLIVEIANLVLEFLKVILSGPVISGLVIIIFMILFKLDIQKLMHRIAKIKFPGGELHASQIEKVKEDKEFHADLLPISIEASADLTTDTQSIVNEDLLVTKEVLLAEKVNARMWEYRYLNYFLARSSQIVLDWLTITTPKTTFSLFDTYWLPVIPNPAERQAIVTALEAHHLISRNGELILITPKGIEYTKWRGPLPNPLAT